MITLTEKGAEKVREFLASQGAQTEAAGLRVGVRGGGCSGFQYALAFDQHREGDTTFEDHGIKLLVDGAITVAALALRPVLSGPRAASGGRRGLQRSHSVLLSPGDRCSPLRGHKRTRSPS